LTRPAPALYGGQRQMPVAEHGVQVLQVTGGRPRGFFRIPSLIHPGRNVQVVQTGRSGHELPHAHGTGPAPGIGIQAAFDHGQVLQFVRHTLFLEDLLDHREVGFGPAEPAQQVLFRLAQQIIHAGFDEPVHGKRNRAGRDREVRGENVFQQRLAHGLHGREHGLAEGEDVAVAQRQRVRRRAVELLVFDKKRAVQFTKPNIRLDAGLTTQRGQGFQRFVQKLGGLIQIAVRFRLENTRLLIVKAGQVFEEFRFAQAVGRREQSGQPGAEQPHPAGKGNFFGRIRLKAFQRKRRSDPARILRLYCADQTPRNQQQE